MSRRGSTPPSTCTTLGSSKQRSTSTLASTSLIFAKNLLLQNVDQKYKDEAINTLKNIQTYRDNNNFEYAGNAVKDVVKEITSLESDELITKIIKKYSEI